MAITLLQSGGGRWAVWRPDGRCQDAPSVRSLWGSPAASAGPWHSSWPRKATSLAITPTGALGRNLAFSCDVAREHEVQNTFEETENNFGQNFLVNAAGINKDSLLVRTETEDMISQLHTNLLGSTLTYKDAMKSMIQQQRGSIVNVGGVIGLKGNSVQSVHSASKGGLVGFSRALAIVARKKIGVNVVAPGFVHTEMTKDFKEEHLKKSIPLGRFGEPADVARAVGFLLEPPYVTGHVPVVDRGLQLAVPRETSPILLAMPKAPRQLFAKSFERFHKESMIKDKQCLKVNNWNVRVWKASSKEPQAREGSLLSPRAREGKNAHTGIREGGTFYFWYKRHTVQQKHTIYSMPHNDEQDAAGATAWDKWRVERGYRCNVRGKSVWHSRAARDLATLPPSILTPGNDSKLVASLEQALTHFTPAERW
ncbi:hypothetical protein MC885_001305, partial [Smutsia gigantea]